MMHMQDAVERGVAHEHVGGGHVDLGAQHAAAVRELALLHAAEQVQVFLHAAVAIGAVDAGGGQGAAVLAHFLGTLVVDVCYALADQVLGDFIQPAEEVGREVQLVPLVAQPLNVGADAVHEHRVLLGGVGVVEAQVAHAAKLFRRAEVYAQRLGVADMQIAVGLGREAGVYALAAAAGQIFHNKLLDEVRGLSLHVLHRAFLLRLYTLYHITIPRENTGVRGKFYRVFAFKRAMIPRQS